MRLLSYLDHMREGVTDALSFTDGISKEEFLADKKTRRAVILCLLIIGEAANNISAISPNFVANHDDMPWLAMRGMRNRVAHRYFDIDLDIVWDTVQQALPQLATSLTHLDLSLD